MEQKRVRSRNDRSVSPALASYFRSNLQRLTTSLDTAIEYAKAGNTNTALAYMAGAEEHAMRARIQIPKRQRAIVQAEILMTEAVDARVAGNRDLARHKIQEIRKLVAEYGDDVKPDRFWEFVRTFPTQS